MASPPDRAELERLSRDDLIARAEDAGVSRASILTRPELVDELLLRSSPRDDPAVAKVRGFFGRARDLLARVIERGLHLPDAAELLRRGATSPPPAPKRTAPAAVPTVTLAEIYATQGHRGRAVETLKRVLEHEPDHGAARSLLTQLAPSVPPPADEAVSGVPVTLGDGQVPPPKAARAPALPSEPPPSLPPEPYGFLDDGLLPPRYDVDECVAVPVDPTTLFAYWEVRATTLAHVRRTRPGGVMALRVLIVTPSWEGPKSTTRDIDVVESLGDWFIRELPAGAVVRVAIGWRTAGVFLPIAHSPALETAPGKPSRMTADAWVRWTPELTVALWPAAGEAGAGDASAAAGGARPSGGAFAWTPWAGRAASPHAAPPGGWAGIPAPLRAGAPTRAGAFSTDEPQGSSEHAPPV